MENEKGIITKQYKFILIDDNDIVLYLHDLFLSEVFEKNNINSFKNPETALNYLLKNCSLNEEYIIILDINMPTMSGWEFINALRQNEIKTKVFIIMATASIDSRDKEIAALYEEVIDFCEKPIDNKFCVNLKSMPAIKHLFN